MKRQLYSALIIPDDNKKRYIRATNQLPYPFDNVRDLYITVNLVTLPFAKAWGNQHHKGLMVVNAEQVKPFQYNIFKRQSPLLFSFLEDAINKWLLDNEFIPLKPLDLGIALPGKIVEFDLGKEVYCMTRNEEGKLIPFTIIKKDQTTGTVTKEKVIQTRARTFLYGIETDTPDYFIERAKQQILRVAAPVKPVEPIDSLQ